MGAHWCNCGSAAKGMVTRDEVEGDEKPERGAEGSFLRMAVFDAIGTGQPAWWLQPPALARVRRSMGTRQVSECAEKSKVVHFGAWLRAKPLKTREFSGCGSMQHPKIEKVMHYGAFWCMEGAEPSKSGEFRGFGDSNDALRTHEKVVHLMQGDERSFSARVGTCERGAHECSRASVPEPALAARLVGRAVALFRGRTRRRAIKPLTSCADAGAREQNRLLRARLLQCNIAIMPKMLHFVAFC